MAIKWRVVYTNQASKDAKKLAQHNLKEKALKIIKILESNPYTPPYEKLVGDLKGAYSRRINIQHRLVYQIYPEDRHIKVIRMWTHYD